jgi:hypothetical protein
MNIWDQKAPNISGILWFIHVYHQFLYQLAMWSFFAPGSRPELKPQARQPLHSHPLGLQVTIKPRITGA